METHIKSFPEQGYHNGNSISTPGFWSFRPFMQLKYGCYCITVIKLGPYISCSAPAKGCNTFQIHLSKGKMDTLYFSKRHLCSMSKIKTHVKPNRFDEILKQCVIKHLFNASECAMKPECSFSFIYNLSIMSSVFIAETYQIPYTTSINGLGFTAHEQQNSRTLFLLFFFISSPLIRPTVNMYARRGWLTSL